MPMKTSGLHRRVIETSLTIAEIAASADGTDQTFTINEGVTAENFVLVHFTDLDADVICCNAHISANNTLKVRFANTTASPITPGATATKILVF